MRVLQAIPDETPKAGEVSAIVPDLVDALAHHNVCASVATPAMSEAELDRAVSETDLVHLHGLFDPFVIRVAALARDRKKPYVLSPCAGLSNNPRQKLGWRRKLALRFTVGKTLRDASRLVACGQQEAAHLSSIGLTATLAVRPAVDAARCRSGHDASRLFDAHPALRDRRILLYLGPIAHPTEGLAPMLKAAAPIADQRTDWQVVLAGTIRGKWRILIEAALRRQRMAERATIIDDPDLSCQRRLLSAAELLACSPLRTAVPVAVAQALAAARPVIAAETLHVPEIAEADAGRIVCPNRRALAGAFQELLAAEPKTLADMGARGAALADKLFQARRNAGRLADLYRSL